MRVHGRVHTFFRKFDSDWYGGGFKKRVFIFKMEMLEHGCMLLVIIPRDRKRLVKKLSLWGGKKGRI